MHELCLCSARLVDVNHASYYVPDQAGMTRPACRYRCYASYLESCALHQELRRREDAARMQEMPHAA